MYTPKLGCRKDWPADGNRKYGFNRFFVPCRHPACSTNFIYRLDRQHLIRYALFFLTVEVAQLVRAPDCGSGGRGFESPLPPLVFEPKINSWTLNKLRFPAIIYPYVRLDNARKRLTTLAFSGVPAILTFSNGSLLWSNSIFLPLLHSV